MLKSWKALKENAKDSVWKKTSTVAPDIITGEEVERITEVVKPTSEVGLEIIVPADEEESKGPQITQLDLF